MSDDSTDIEISGEINAGWTSYYDPDIHGPMHQNNDSETVDVAESDGGDTGGEVSTDFIPNEVENPTDLSETKQEILKLAGSNPNRTAASIDDQLGTSQYANKVLSKECPEWYENVFKAKGTSPRSNRDNSGKSEDTSQAASEGGKEPNMKTETVEFVQEDTAGETPDNSEWDKFSDDANTSSDSEHFSEGDKRALQSLFSTDKAELQAGIDAMKSVATHEETIKALEWVEQYL